MGHLSPYLLQQITLFHNLSSFLFRQWRWTRYRRTGTSVSMSAERPCKGLCGVCLSAFADEKATAIVGSREPDVSIY